MGHELGDAPLPALGETVLIWNIAGWAGMARRFSPPAWGAAASWSRIGGPLKTECNATIRRTLDLGINLLDSSDACWGGRRETLPGRALKGRLKLVLFIKNKGRTDHDA